MESKKKYTTLKKKDSKIKYKIPNNNKRLTQTQSSKKIPINLSTMSQPKPLMTDLDNISSRQTSDSFFNNKKNNTSMNFVYKKNTNRPKISVKVIKNSKSKIFPQKESTRKTLLHSSSTGYLIMNKLTRMNSNNIENKVYDTDSSYSNIRSNNNWIHSPKKNHQKLFTENIRDINPKCNMTFINKMKEINLSSIQNINSYTNNNNYNINYNKINNNNNNNNNNSYCHKQNMENLISNKKNKKTEIINIEDLLLLDENFNEVINSIPTNFNINNTCFEFINIYVNSSLNCNFEKYFTDYQSKIIVHISIMLMIFNIIITYHISFSPPFLNSCNNFLKSLIILSHKSFLLICNLISNVISSSAQDNIWVKKLRKLLEVNIAHIDQNDQEFIMFLSSRNLKMVNSVKIDSLIEIKYYSSNIKKYIRLLLNNMSDNDILKNEFYELFNNIDNLSFNNLNDFYIKKVLRIINKNASITGKNASSYGAFAFCNIKTPYLSNRSNKKFTLVLDLDETLIAFKINPIQENKGLLKFRPGLDFFLLKMKNIYEIVVFTSATQEYADPIENCIEQNEKYFDARLYRQHTIIFENDFVKDISRIGRPMNSIIIVDNMPQNFRMQKENGIFIKPFWGDDIFDTALFSLADILEKIYNQFDDVRQGIFHYKDEILNKVTSNFSKRGNI